MALSVALISISLFCWAAWPNQQERYSQQSSSTDFQTLSKEVIGRPVEMDARQVTLEWPSVVRIGEEKEIILSFEPAGAEDVIPTLKVGRESVYDQYSLMAEGRVEMAGIRVSPAEVIRQSMPQGQAVKFRWQISSEAAGSYDGAVWLSLRLLPLDGGQVIQVPIIIKGLKIRASSLLGMKVGTVYVLGGVGVLLAGGLVFGDLRLVVRRWAVKKRQDNFYLIFI